MRIQPTQSSSLRDQRKAQDKLRTSLERLSSGKRLNRSADGPAGLAILSQLEAQELSLGQASRNTSYGINIAQTMDGAMAQQSNILGQMRTLSLHASNGTITTEDRQMIQQQFEGLRSELDRIATTTTGGGQPLLQGGSMELQVGSRSGADSQVTLTNPESTAGAMGLAANSLATTADAWTAIDSIDGAIAHLNTQRASVGSTENRLEFTQSNLHQTLETHAAARSRIADTDIASESMQLGRHRLMLQAALKMQQIENQQKGMLLDFLA